MVQNTIVISQNDLVRLVREKSREFAIDVVNDHVLPHDARRAKKIIAAIKKETKVTTDRKKARRQPREIEVRILR